MARLAPSLVRLDAEINTRWPKRKKHRNYTAAQDAWMGDAAHAARRSEHNPDHRGVVHAKDIAVAGINVTDVMKRLIGDPRVWYVIFNGFIWSVKNDWKPEVYRGDPHHEHIHVSLLVPYAAYGTAKRVKKAETSVAGWGLAYLSHPKVFVAVVGRGFLKKYNRKGL